MCRWRLPALELFSLIGLIAVAIWYVPNVMSSQDTNIYATIALDVVTGGSVASEYPPLATALFVLLERLSLGFGMLHLWLPFLGIALLSTAGIAMLLRSSVPVITATFLSTLLLGPELLLARFDVLVFFLLLLCILFERQKKYFWAAAVLAIACCIKIVPLLLLPALFAVTPRNAWMRLLNGFIAGVVAAVLASIAVLGLHGFLENSVYLWSYHGSRGMQIESMWSSIDLFLRQLFYEKAPVTFQAMSAVNASFDVSMPTVAAFLVVSGAGGFALSAWWSSKKPTFFTLVIGTILWMLAVSPILSPQYLVWVLPIVFVVSIERSIKNETSTTTFLMLLVAIGVAEATQWVFPNHYSDILDQSSLWTIAVLLLRNLGLIALLVVVFWDAAWFPSVPPVTKPKEVSWKKLTGILLAGLVVVGCLFHFFQPTIGPVEYQFTGQEQQTGSLPLFPDTQGDHIDVYFSMVFPMVHPTTLRIRPDDCLESMEINGQSVDPERITFCEYGIGQNINLGEYLQPGLNTFSFHIRDDGGQGGVNVTVARTDPLFIFPFAVLLVLILWYGLALAMHPNIVEQRSLWFILIGGIVLRILYVMGTPHELRGYDTEAHIDYIRFVADHFTIPLAVNGWEFHQPPLYYYLMGSWMRVMELLGQGMATILQDIQIASLVFSVGTLVASFSIARTLFPKGHAKASLLLALVAVMPALVFNASRISNDTLATFLSFVVFAFLVMFWKEPRLRTWYTLCVLLGFLALTKVSAYALIAICFLCFALVRGLPWKKKILHGTLSCVLVLLLFGWLPVKRFLEPDPTRTLTLGNHGMSSGLLIGNEVEHYTTFDPLAILTVPYNNPWNDANRRQYFHEYFFRSALTGEFGFDDSVRWINVLLLLSALVFLPLIVVGIVRSLWKEPMRTFPLWLTLGILYAAALSYRIKFPYGANQDFRFVMLLTIPLVYFAIEGTMWKSKLARMVTRIPFVSFVVCSALFLVLVALGGT